jgi:hypothetical protein
MSIIFIGSKEFNDDADGATYTITNPLPSGLATNDVCIIAVACPTDTSGAAAFTGWTLVRQVDEGSNHRASIWYRVIQAGDTDATDFTFDPQGTAEGINWITALYRGVNTSEPFYVEDAAFSATDADNSLVSPTVTNADDRAWAVSAGLSSDTATGDASLTWSGTGSGWTTTERNEIDASAETTASHSVGFYDSNGVITTGAKSVTHAMASTTTDVDMVSWIGILRPAGLPTAGSSLLLSKTACVVRAHYW